MFQLALTWMAVPSGPSRLSACCKASVRRRRLTAGPARAANTHPHTSRASASVVPAAAPTARPRPRCAVPLPIIRLSSRDEADGSVTRESVALLCPAAVPCPVPPRSGAGQRAERDDQVAVVRGGLPTHLPCPLHTRAASDQGRLRRAGELQADASLGRSRGVLGSWGGGSSAGRRGEGGDEAVEQVLGAERDRGLLAGEVGGHGFPGPRLALGPGLDGDPPRLERQP